MLDPHVAFEGAGLLAIAGWLLILAGLFVRPLRRFVWPVARFGLPALLAVAYVFLIVEGVRQAQGDLFGSIGAIRDLFANDSALAAGWLHYLAFDLFIGTWEAEDAEKSGVPAWLVVPCLALTFLFGPVGLLLYFILRLAFMRRNTNREMPS
jgi:hypothetical protein